MQKKKSCYVKKGRLRPCLITILPLIPEYPKWVTCSELAKKLGITTDRVQSWIAAIPTTEPIALDDLSKGFKKYCYIRDSSGKLLI